MTKKNKTLMLVIFAAMAYISGCSKTATTPASIVGTWSQISQTRQLLINNAYAQDTTVAVGASSNILSFNSAGYFTQFTGSGTLGGGYFVVGDTLSLFDTISGVNSWLAFRVNTLTAHSLVLQEDQFHTGDSIFRILATFSR